MRLTVIGSFGMARVKLEVNRDGEKLELLESKESGCSIFELILNVE